MPTDTDELIERARVHMLHQRRDWHECTRMLLEMIEALRALRKERDEAQADSGRLNWFQNMQAFVFAKHNGVDVMGECRRDEGHRGECSMD